MSERRDMSGVLFKPVPFAPSYEAGEDGTVRRRTKAISTRPGKVLKPYIRRDGYCQYTLRENGRSIVCLGHKIIAVTFHGDAPSAKHEVAHWDGCKTNNAASNLRWCSRTENAQDMVRHGRSGKGERNVCAVMTEDMVRYVRRKAKKRGDIAALSRELGINIKTIHQAVTGQNWGHVR